MAATIFVLSAEKYREIRELEFLDDSARDTFALRHLRHIERARSIP